MGAPALIDAQSQSILEFLDAMAGYNRNHVHEARCSDGGTTQAPGAGTAPNVDVDSAGSVDIMVNGLKHELAAAADIDPDAGDQVAWGAESGVEVSGFALVETGSSNDAPAYVIVFGDVATTAVGSELPDDDAISTFVGHDNWVKICGILLTRTGAGTITIAFDHTEGDRGAEGQPGSFSTSESEFNAA